MCVSRRCRLVLNADVFLVSREEIACVPEVGSLVTHPGSDYWSNPHPHHVSHYDKLMSSNQVDRSSDYSHSQETPPPTPPEDEDKDKFNLYLLVETAVQQREKELSLQV